MRPSFGRVDAVGEGKDVFRIGVIVLQRHFHGTVLPRPADVDGVLMEDFFVPVDVLYEGDDAAFIKEFTFPVVAVVDQGDENPRVQKGQLPQAIGEDVEIEF
ncbi:MAG: hypothetical protein A4E72_00258 [Syntrophus sp. PtaU1.Bin208]|nr:MAG: hypothetical protein A4E72_00258 [Syntrophus sp. PtaU1.Bin208]